MTKSVCIIGAGASGLTCIKVCKEENLNITCYERTAFVGGLWRYHEDEDPKLASVTRSTIINSSKEMSAYSDFPPPKEFPNYMHNTLMHKYFMLYAEEHKAYDYIRFRHEVQQVIEADDYEKTGRWKVTVKNLDSNEVFSRVFDAVMVCSGHHFKPLEARFPGQEKFKGEIIHTHSYKTPKPFDGKRCVVVGIGNSGGDAAVELSMFAKKTYLSTRRGAWILWRVGPGGMPFDSMYIRRFVFNLFAYVPYWLSCFVVENYVNLRFNHKAYSIQPNHYILSQHPMVNDALPNRILSGTVIVKGDIKEFTENGIIFKGDSDVTEVDSVILATGYEVDFGFIDKRICWGKNNEVQLYKYMFNPNLKHPETLSFIGLIQAFGPAIPISEVQARWHVQLLLGKCKPLPSVQKMQQDIAIKREEIDRRYFKGARHTMQVDWVPFMDEISSQFGAKPNMLKYFFTDPSLWATLYFGPCLPYQYRLNGPHPWAGAKNAIYTVNERVTSALKTRPQESNESQHFLAVLLRHINKFASSYLHLNGFVAIFGLIFICLGFLFIRNY